MMESTGGRETLSEREVRIVGSLIEKEGTTPEYYPLTLNALVNACNQKSNRSPVVAYTHAEVSSAVDALRWKGWLVVVDEAGSRAGKYRHRFSEKTGLGEKETALLAELMLRGAQTAGELRGRASRMAPFAGLEEVQAVLEALAGGDRPWVVRLPRQRGFKERRCMHLLGGEPPAVDEEAPEAEGTIPAASSRPSGLVEELWGEVAALRARIEALEETVETLRSKVG